MINIYSIQNDTLNSSVSESDLETQIQSSEITISLEGITATEDILKIFFKASLTSSEKVLLDALVSAHDGIPSKQIETVNMIASIAEGGKQKSDRGFIFTADKAVDISTPSLTVKDYLITESLQIKGGILQTSTSHIQDSCSMEIVDTAYLYAGSWYPATPIEAGIVGTEGLTWAQVVPSGVSLHHYLKDFPVSKEGRTIIKNNAITTTPLNGLTLRVTYVAIGIESDVLCNVGIVAYI